MSCPYCEGFVSAHGEPFKAVKDKESDTLWVYFHGTCNTCERPVAVCVPATIDWEEYTDLEEDEVETDPEEEQSQERPWDY